MTTPTFTVRVACRQIEADGICSFELVHPEGRPLPAFEAGAHIDVHVPGGIVRQYSLCNDPSENDRYLIAVLRDPASRGGSTAMHDAVQQGSELQISAPRNHFALAKGRVRHLLLAGGIGLTPLLSMAEHLAAEGEEFRLHYCARSRARAAFVTRIAQSRFAPRAQFHFSEGDASKRIDLGQALSGPAEDLHLYVCGPQGFMDAVLETARMQGWPDHRVHYEYFTAPAVQPLDGGQFEVRIASSGRVISIPPELSVVRALEQAGVEIPVSCEQGLCGTCLTRVLDGEPDHRDLFLSPEEQAQNDRFMPCCSRAKSRLLVLDL
jgi:vanillate monooxygenase ferredoxin subunit